MGSREWPLGGTERLSTNDITVDMEAEAGLGQDRMTVYAPVLCSIYRLVCRQGERGKSSLCFCVPTGGWRKLGPLQAA